MRPIQFLDYFCYLCANKDVIMFIFFREVYAHIFIFVCTGIYVYICMYRYIYLYLNVQVYIFIFVCTGIYVSYADHWRNRIG